MIFQHGERQWENVDTIHSEFVFEDCLVTPSVYEGVLQQFDEFILPFISHLPARSQQPKARDYT